MRQGGLKPKSHSSGIYWVRASKGSGGNRTNTQISDNGERSRLEDGDPTNIISPKQKIICFCCCFFGLIGWIIFTFMFF